MPGAVRHRGAADAAHRGRTEQVLFARCVSGDADARGELIERLLPLARSVARRYQRSGEPLEDLYQIASLALVKAIDRYDPDRGFAFSSFAVPTIAGELNRYFRDRGWIVRPPRNVQELAFDVERATRVLSQQCGRSPTVAELAAATSRDEEQILEGLCARDARSGLSVHAPRGADGVALEECVATVDSGFERAESRATIDALTANISPLAREILRLRFDQDMTQQQIADRLQVSQMRVSRTLRATLRRLRAIAEHDELAPDRGLSQTPRRRRSATSAATA